MTDIISSDLSFTQESTERLSALLDTLVPASADATMPSAADVDFVSYLKTQEPAFVDDVRVVLGHLDDAFVAAELDERVAAVRVVQ